MQTGVWKTKGGADIRICDMDNTHLVHTILFLERLARDKDLNKWDEFVRPIYWCMLEEIEDRLMNERIHGLRIVNNRLAISSSEAPLGTISGLRKRDKTEEAK